MKKFVLLLVIVALGVGGWLVWRGQASKNAETKIPGQAATFNKQLYSLDDPASSWVVVNKHRLLQPADYKPADLAAPAIPLRLPGNKDEMLLRAEPAAALEAMYNAAKKDGLELMVASAFRSYNYQKGLYSGYVKQQGQAAADTQSARPGYSEHQTGLAVDLEPASRKCEVEACFADTPEGKWLDANAYRFGFVIRYPKDKQAITGYMYEPWHVRYVGRSLALQLHYNGQTLEEFFDLGAAPDYL